MTGWLWVMLAVLAGFECCFVVDYCCGWLFDLVVVDCINSVVDSS